MTKIL